MIDRIAGYQLPQPGALITSADNSWPPPLPFHTAQKFLFPTYSRFINIPHPYKHTHSHRQTHTHTHTHTLTGTCIKSVNMFGWGIFGAVWKGRNGSQELSAEMSGHLVEVAGTHLFAQSFCLKHISLLCAPIGAYFRWYLPFPCYTRDFTCRIIILKIKKVLLVYVLKNVSWKFITSIHEQKV